ncbi:MAG TPA: hemerythrin domain-containing protein [Candidatus Babeliales bacterium]|nr:hemerythrin domain-containing protein [Candidatus Babeliales bacterium]
MRNFLQKKYFSILFFIGTINQPYLCADKKSLPMNIQEESEIPLTEDLMREHGLLNRILLIYEEIVKRIDNNTNFSIIVLNNAVEIIRSFIENYHEKLEEDYIFPLFEKHKKEIKLVKTLKAQHNKGREITAQLQKLSIENKPLDQKTRKLIKNLLQKFIRMYRPHEAREDTVLFPQVRSLMTESEFKNMSKIFEDREHELFGEDGFELMIKKVEDIEKDLDIYRLEQFTP